MKKYFVSLYITLLLPAFFSFAQKIQNEEITYRHFQLPLMPLDKSIKNYQAIVFAAYAEKDKQLKADYEQELKIVEEEYKKEMEPYYPLIKAADDQYILEMDEYNKKSLGRKVVEETVLKQNTKPVKQVINTPSMREVKKPVLKNLYDCEVLANAYIHLEGYENAPSSAVQVIVSLYGYDCTQQRVVSEQRTKTSLSNGATSNTTETFYHTEFSYRHPMSVKVIAPDGKEIWNVTPQEFNSYKTIKSPESTIRPQLTDQSIISKTYEDKSLQDNLTAINEWVNNQYGFFKATRLTTLGYVKNKGDEYADLLSAFNEASSGLTMLADEKDRAIKKLKSSAEVFKKALAESDIKNKKARIDQGVTVMIYFNLMEIYFALKDVEEGNDLIQKMNILNLSTVERKKKEDFEKLYADLKKRILSNKN